MVAYYTKGWFTAYLTLKLTDHPVFLFSKNLSILEKKVYVIREKGERGEAGVGRDTVLD